MPPKVVLITGVGRRLAGRLAGRLAADPDIDRVIGVDAVPPSRELAPVLGRAEFVRVDIRSPLIAKVIAAAEVDTVVHLSITSAPGPSRSRASAKEINVIGTMQLLAACQNAPSVRRLVVKSSTAVYGASPSDPAMFTEETEPRSPLRAGYGKDAVDIEGYLRGFGRRRPEVCLTVLRFANLIGPHVASPLTRYLSRRVVPTVFGYDPRVQLLHEDDGLDVLQLAATTDRPGTFNVGADGVLMLSQVIRRSGRIMLPVPSRGMGAMTLLTRLGPGFAFSAQNIRYLHFGRVVDNARLKSRFGYLPTYTTAQAFDDFVRSATLPPVLDPALLARAEQLARGVLARAGCGPAGGADG
ncbi:MAG: NAD-dependent epimerase/dehydratase family protein [Actinobacteria bacterium]|nr:NAD-dependent epimerase/dehydratase family protein [Actinomycetota bacterium]MBI3688811.1 NAD-dependent epimerase/dehydratase family protein [Actinomycetota bacterium]